MNYRDRARTAMTGDAPDATVDEMTVPVVPGQHVPINTNLDVQTAEGEQPA